MRHGRARIRLAVALGCTLGCMLATLASCAPRSGTETIAPGDPQHFDAFVQPYLELRCASLDCHGAPGRPLRLYSELGLRRDAQDRRTPTSELYEPSPLSAEELANNRLGLAAVATASAEPSAHLALLKPLALSVGGIAHEGGVHWASRSEAGYLCLRGYLVGGLEADLAATCARATAEALPAPALSAGARR